MNIDFNKTNGLVPVVVQDSNTQKVLMLGYMNEEALKITRKTNNVTFFSRTRKTIWTKGETSGNFLEVRKILIDCDNDTLLIKANPVGPTCHTGDDTCFKEENKEDFFKTLREIIKDRKENPSSSSYTSSFFEKSVNSIAQKVGEEATEVVIDAVSGNKERAKEECADLLYHLLILLEKIEINFDDVVGVLENRHKK